MGDEEPKKQNDVKVRHVEGFDPTRYAVEVEGEIVTIPASWSTAMQQARGIVYTRAVAPVIGGRIEYAA